MFKRWVTITFIQPHKPYVMVFVQSKLVTKLKAKMQQNPMDNKPSYVHVYESICYGHTTNVAHTVCRLPEVCICTFRIGPWPRCAAIGPPMDGNRLVSRSRIESVKWTHKGVLCLTEQTSGSRSYTIRRRSPQNPPPEELKELLTYGVMNLVGRQKTRLFVCLHTNTTPHITFLWLDEQLYRVSALAGPPPTPP